MARFSKFHSSRSTAAYCTKFPEAAYLSSFTESRGREKCFALYSYLITQASIYIGDWQTIDEMLIEQYKRSGRTMGSVLHSCVDIDPSGGLPQFVDFTE